jgi:hypothetical protein
MPTNATLLVRLREGPDSGDLNRWRRDLLTEFDPDEFYDDGPLQIVRGSYDGPVAINDGSWWLNVGIRLNYYGEGYERGDPVHLARLAEWLEQRIPDCEVWYGHDIADESIKPFGPAERDALLTYYRQVGNEPYDSKFRHHRHRPGE